MRRSTLWRAIWCVGLGLAATASQAAAAVEEPGITVIGTAEIVGRPKLAEIHARIVGSAELSSDALVKFFDARRRARAAIDQLKIKNLRAEDDGMSISVGGGQPAELTGVQVEGAPPPARGQVEFSSRIRLILAGIDELSEEKLMQLLSQVLDRLHDSGVEVQPAQASTPTPDDDSGQASVAVASFVLPNAAELRDKATKQAFAAARVRAERLAKLADVKLGTVVAVQDWPAENADAQADEAETGEPPNRDDKSKDRLVSRTFGPIAVRSSLQVRFAIQQK